MEVIKVKRVTKVKRWKGEKMANAFKGEKLKRWKGEKMANAFKSEKVKSWKGEKMANATCTFGLTP